MAEHKTSATRVQRSIGPAWQAQMVETCWGDDCLYPEVPVRSRSERGEWHDHFVPDPNQIEGVTGNYDWEEGGILRGTDTAFIARARTDVPRLVVALEAVLGELAGHPECDVHPDDDPVTCGWKSAVIGVRRAIESALAVEEEGKGNAY